MENIVTAIFEVESEAFQSFVNLRNNPSGEGYAITEAALVKRQGDRIVVSDSFDAAGITSDDTATGMVVGSLVGILGGPLGVLLGASIGALAGSTLDADDAIDSASMLEVTARKLYDNEAAIIAFVKEDEPAFDAAFTDYDVTIERHFAADVYNEVERARELETELANQAKAEMRADKKAARKERRTGRIASIAARFSGMKEKRAERKAQREAKKEEVDSALDIAEAQYVSSTDEMFTPAKHVEPVDVPKPKNEELDEAIETVKSDFVEASKEILGEE